MKLLKRIAAGCAALMLLSSCSVLSGLASSGSSVGSSTGSAISAIYNILKATGGIDLSNLANIINIGQILTGANTLTNATASYTNDFAQGLISGSSNLVNAGNVSTVLSSLKSLANIDTSAFTQAAATKGYASTTPALSTSDKNVDATVKALTGLLGSL